MRAELLARSPWCIGFPVGFHGKYREPATVADHRVTMKQGGRSELANYDPLCKRCNGAKAVALEGARPRR